jgi:anhydro-N-acetylmuramic acid kinase
VQPRLVVGLSSGSSLDGADAALLELDGTGLDLTVRLLLSIHQPYAPDLSQLIRKAGGPGPSEGRLTGLLHRLLGETFAAAARHVVDRASLSLQRVQCLGCPGHALWQETEGRFPFTLALGMPAVIAERTGVTTVSDFGSRDLAAGGQGALLEAFPDYILFRHPEENRLLIHLGGTARVVYLPAGCRVQQVVAFEAAPCSLLLDELMRRLTGGRESYDPGGKHGVQGHCLDSLLQRWLGHPLLQRRPPRSLPRPGLVDEFLVQGVQAARQSSAALHDLVCTATHFVARAVALSVRRFLPEIPQPARALLSGGGTRNGFLWHLLQQQLPGWPLERTDAYGVPSAARKALAFGVLAALTLDGVSANLPSVTGAAGTRLLGSLTPGSAANWARCLSWMAGQITPVPAYAD